MEKSGIYILRNTADGKVYVGQSVSIHDRRIHHFGKLKRGRHSNHHLQNAFNKYGKDSFEFRILELVDEDMLDIRERAWINYYKSCDPSCGYNYDTGGNRYKRASEESLSRRRLFRHTEESRSKISAALMGHGFSEETLKKMAEAKKGKLRGPLSDETRRKISEAHKRRLACRAA